VWPAAKIAAVDIDKKYEQSCLARGANRFHIADFLKLDLQAADLILGNPPYSLAEEFIRHAWICLPPGGSICFLLRGGFRAGVNRWSDVGLLMQAPIRDSWPVVPRPSFSGDGATEGTEYEVLLWTIGYGGTIEPIRWKKR
jgi:hypothetical protein